MSRRRFFLRPALLPLITIAIAGCRDEREVSSTSADDAPAKVPPSVTLRVLVVNEPELAEAIERLDGEWAQRFGGKLTAVSMPWDEVSAGDSLDADVVVFPSGRLGELCSRELLRPVRSSVLESALFNADDVFPLVRRELITWSGQVVALPLGVDKSVVGESPNARPALRLLAEAAPDLATDQRDGDLFDPHSLAPRIAEPAFVEALTRLAASESKDERAPSEIAARVPVLGVDDRLAAVTSSSRNAATAFKLLGWLAGPEISSQLARTGESTKVLPVRRSLASSPAWYPASTSAARRNEIGRTLEQSLCGEPCFVVPRIPGVEEYLATLDTAVEQAFAQEAQPQAALDAAAREWESITDAHGRNTQREAYLKHLGIAGP